MFTFITSRKLWLGFAAYLMVTAAASLAISLPSTAGGIGPFELVVLEALTFPSISSELAGAYAVALHGFLLLPVIAAGIVFLWTINLALGRTLIGEQPE